MAGKKNKIIFAGEVLIDLTKDTVEASKLLEGYTSHDKSGEIITGTCTFDSDTSDATATADEILQGKTAYAKGSVVTGNMKNNGAFEGEISTVAGKCTIPNGFHDGSGFVQISEVEQAKITAPNIREGIEILGVVGTMSGTEGVNAETKEVTPKKEEQVVVPGDGYNYLAQVTVKGIPYSETENPEGGITVTIGDGEEAISLSAKRKTYVVK